MERNFSERLELFNGAGAGCTGGAGVANLRSPPTRSSEVSPDRCVSVEMLQMEVDLSKCSSELQALRHDVADLKDAEKALRSKELELVKACVQMDNDMQRVERSCSSRLDAAEQRIKEQETKTRGLGDAKDEWAKSYARVEDIVKRVEEAGSRRSETTERSLAALDKLVQAQGHQIEHFMQRDNQELVKLSQRVACVEAVRNGPLYHSNDFVGQAKQTVECASPTASTEASCGPRGAIASSECLGIVHPVGHPSISPGIVHGLHDDVHVETQAVHRLQREVDIIKEKVGIINLESEEDERARSLEQRTIALESELKRVDKLEAAMQVQALSISVVDKLRSLVSKLDSSCAEGVRSVLQDLTTLSSDTNENSEEASQPSVCPSRRLHSTSGVSTPSVPSWSAPRRTSVSPLREGQTRLSPALSLSGRKETSPVRESTKPTRHLNPHLGCASQPAARPRTPLGPKVSQIVERLQVSPDTMPRPSRATLGCVPRTPREDLSLRARALGSARPTRASEESR